MFDQPVGVPHDDKDGDDGDDRGDDHNYDSNNDDDDDFGRKLLTGGP